MNGKISGKTKAAGVAMTMVCVLLLLVLCICHVSASTAYPRPTVSGIIPATATNDTSVRITNLAGTNFWGSSAETSASLFQARY